MLTQINDLNTLFDRLMTIIGPAQRFRERFEADLAKGETAHQHTLINMLREFEEFAGAYFRYVASGSGLVENDADILLRELRVAISKLHAEWVEISRACEQRQVEEFQGALRQADEQTKIFYDRFLGYKVGSMPITYFGRFTNITRSYFNRYPLISLPLYDFNNAEQIELALAHEIGHYIFWNSAPLYDYEEVQNQFAYIVLHALDEPVNTRTKFLKKLRMIDIWLHWLEETFADICGALLAGPDYATSAITIAREVGRDPSVLTSDDRAHPTRYLRPLIAVEALRWVQQHSNHSILSERINALEKSWEQQFPNLEELRAVMHVTGDVTMREIEQQVPGIVHAMLDGMPANRKDGNWIRYEGDLQPVLEKLGNLINYNIWLQELGNQEIEEQRKRARISFEASVGKAQAAYIRQKLDQLPPSPTFNQLLQQMRQHFSDETEVRQALLKLTAHTRDWNANCRLVEVCES